MVDDDNKAAKGEAQEGDIIENPLGLVFGRLVREKRTGFLDVLDKAPDAGGRIGKRVVMKKGEAFAVKGGSVKETLPGILLEQKKISPEQYEALKEECGGDYNKMEMKVLMGQVVPPGEIAALVAQQVTVKIKGLFLLVRGHFIFRNQADTELNGKFDLIPMNPDQLIIECLRDTYPPARIKTEFAGIEKKNFSLVPGLDARLMEAGFNLKTARYFKSLGGNLTWPGVMKSLPLDDKEKAPFLLALYFSGMAALDPKDEDFPLGQAYLDPEEKAKEEKKRKEEEAAKLEAAKEEAARAAAKAAGEKARKEAAAKLPIEELLDAEMSDQDLLKHLDKFLQVIGTRDKTYYEWMQLDEKVPPAKIKQVFFKFAKRYHPDARPDLFKGEIKEKVEEFFTKITEAYDTLGDQEKRAAYLESLNSRVSKEDMEKAQRAIEAEMEFQKAEIFLKRGNFTAAREMLERVIQLQPDEPEFKIYLAWADFKVKGVAEAGKAQREIKKHLEQRPKAADGVYFLAMIAKSEGDLDEAEKLLGQALQMKPADVDYKRELQLLQRRKASQAPPPEKSKGGFFGKKK